MVFAARPCHACAHTVLHCTLFFFFTDPATTEIYTLSLHDALPIWCGRSGPTTRAAGSARRLPEWWHVRMPRATARRESCDPRSEEHTSELQSLTNLVCRLLLEKKKTILSCTGKGVTQSGAVDITLD